MRTDLLRRLEKLEQARVPRERPVLIIVTHSQGERAPVGAERIVQDWYSDSDGLICARERITTDPDDQGERCLPNGRLEHVIRELEGMYKREVQEASADTP